MFDWFIFLPLLTIGFVSSAHCIGMCGGIMGALTIAIPAEAKHKRWKILIAYNIGRIASYCFMGFLLGFFVSLFTHWGGGNFLRILAGLLLIAMGLYLADWWRGLTRLEHAGRYLWAYLQPFSKHLLPVDNIGKALLLGALWGWLPCGLVYSALALAITQPSPWFAAGGMLAFGIGTLPAVLTASFAAQQLTRLLQKRHIRVALAALIILYGCWTIFGSLGHAGHNHSNSETHQEHNHNMMNGAMQVHDDKSSGASSIQQPSHQHHH